jgi:hypothetical protein
MTVYYDTITGIIYNTEIKGSIPSITDDFVEIDETTYYNLLSQTYSDSTKTLTFDAGTSGLTLSEAPSITFTDQELIGIFYSGVYSLLDEISSVYGYNGIVDAVSYYNSGITAWRDEAIAFNTWRDNTVSLMYDNIFSFTADGITLPSLTSGGFTGQTGYFDIGITASRPQLFS